MPSISLRSWVEEANFVCFFSKRPISACSVSGGVILLFWVYRWSRVSGRLAWKGLKSRGQGRRIRCWLLAVCLVRSKVVSFELTNWSYSLYSWCQLDCEKIRFFLLLSKNVIQLKIWPGLGVSYHCFAFEQQEDLGDFISTLTLIIRSLQCLTTSMFYWLHITRAIYNCFKHHVANSPLLITLFLLLHVAILKVSVNRDAK
jgi:hypothetical protein